MLSAPWIILNSIESWICGYLLKVNRKIILQTKQCKILDANPDILQIYPEPNRETLKQSNAGEDWNKLRCLS